MKVSQEQSSGITKSVGDIEPGDVYAVTGGRYLGEFFVFIEKVDKTYQFLSLPSMEPRAVPYSKCKNGIDDKIMDLVEILPDNIFEVCTAQYRKNKR
tara:strand:+ start:2346 stop:2636 length:291 start_codon:yes stop_codon:yes gene_type:complete